jgi:uncharacterized SAM-dependent methyltransferase
MSIKKNLLDELIKQGYSEENSTRVWDLAHRSFRYINEDMAKAFLKIKEHPRAKLTIIDTEIKLLKDNISKFLKPLEDSNFNLIDMGCSDGNKAKAIIDTLDKKIKFRYCPVNVSNYLVKLASNNIKKENYKNVIEHAPRLSKNFESLDEIGAALRNNSYQKNAYLLLGSLLASFDINHYLFKLSQSMLPGDILIIGNGIRTGERFSNLETYKHAIFNNWLIHLMKELDFKEEEVEYNARFANNRLEAYYTIKKDKKISHDDKEIEFKTGDKILVSFQHKLFEEELKNFCKMYFDSVELVKDPENEYALVMCKK